jgi:peptide deformylase
VNLQLVIFGSDQPNPRYPDRPLVPKTVLINPVITPIGEADYKSAPVNFFSIAHS